MNLQLVDCHTHTQFAAFAYDQDAVIRRALDAGIWIINVGTQKDTSEKAIETMQKYPEGIYATVGLHPIHTERLYHDSQELGDSRESKGFTSRGEEFDYGYYKKLAEYPKVVAIGECGLDYYRLGEETKEKQKTVFVQQIELAKELKKPLMIHCRNAFQDLIDILKSNIHNLNPSIVHFFTGTIEDARKLLDMGFLFSFGGVITFVHDYDEVVKYIPIDNILLETDAPYVTPVPYRGQRNEPLYIKEIALNLSELKECSLDSLAEITSRNAKTIFEL